MSDREQQISEIITEFADIFSSARTRWMRYAAELHDELRGASLMMLQFVMRKGPISATELGHALDMDKAMVSRHVASLRDLGFIEATESEEDRRVQLLSASPQGLALLDRLHKRSAASYQARFEGWDVEELQRLREGLHRFNNGSR